MIARWQEVVPLLLPFFERARGADIASRSHGALSTARKREAEEPETAAKAMYDIRAQGIIRTFHSRAPKKEEQEKEK